MWSKQSEYTSSQITLHSCNKRRQIHELNLNISGNRRKYMWKIATVFLYIYFFHGTEVTIVKNASHVH